MYNGGFETVGSTPQRFLLAWALQGTASRVPTEPAQTLLGSATVGGLLGLLGGIFAEGCSTASQGGGRLDRQTLDSALPMMSGAAAATVLLLATVIFATANEHVKASRACRACIGVVGISEQAI